MTHNVLHLYQVFSKYPEAPLRDSDPNDCSAGDGFAEKLYETLRGKPLGSLSELELLDYYFLAVSHIGTVDDFKHYLPRILELMATARKSLLSPKMLADKLKEAEFSAWPLEERQAVIGFCRESQSTSKLPKVINDLPAGSSNAAV